MSADQKLVLIVGTGRSGTTLIAKVFDSAPAVLYRHEPDYTNINTHIPFLLKNGDIDLHLAKAKDYFESLMQQRDARTSGTRPIFSKSFRNKFGNTVNHLSVLSAKVAYRLGVSMSIPDLVVDGRDPIHVIKSVNSLCRTPLFSAAMPKMHIVHVIRHPCAIITSKRRGMEKSLMKEDVYIDSLFNSGLTEGYNLTRESIKSKSWEEQAAFQWLVMNNSVYEAMHKYEHYMPLSYEAFCTNPLDSARSLFEFSNVPWNSQTEGFLNQLIGYEGRSGAYFSLHRGLKSSLISWRQEMPDNLARVIENMIRQFPISRAALPNETAPPRLA